MTRSLEKSHNTLTKVFSSFEDDTHDTSAHVELSADDVEDIRETLHDHTEIARTGQARRLGSTVVAMAEMSDLLYKSNATPYEISTSLVEVAASLYAHGNLPEPILEMTIDSLNRQYPPSSDSTINTLNLNDKVDRLRAIQETDQETTVWEALNRIQAQREGNFDRVIAESGEIIAAHDLAAASIATERAEQELARTKRLASPESSLVPQFNDDRNDPVPTKPIDMSQFFDD